MIQYIKESDEVLYAIDEIKWLSSQDINELIKLAKNNNNKRVRICAHQNISNNLHEMFIVHAKGAHIPVHKHVGRSESLFVLKGKADFIEFSDDGDVSMCVTLGELTSGYPFYRKISSNVFHTLVIKSEWFVFLEVTSGPFDRRSNVFADWSHT